MKKIQTIIFLVALTNVCTAQVADDFNDGNFTANPAWSGTTSQFIVNAAGQLQLNATTAGTSYLSTRLSASSLDDFEWFAFVRFAFAASGSNYGRIYLASDQADLTKPLNGYYLQLGEAGSADAIELFRQSGAVSTSVCRGTAGAIANAFSVRIKVTRDASGNWQLLTDYSGGTNFVADASGVDLTFSTTSFCGVVAVYTASNGTKFFFDDFYAGPPPGDTTPPTVTAVNVLSGRSLSVFFSEPVTATSVVVLTNYSAGNNSANPVAAVLQPDQQTVILTFSDPFPNGINQMLRVVGLADLNGNVMNETTLPFLFFAPGTPHYKAVLFSEIFPDPTPQVALPPQEFIEFFNRTADPFDLTGWKFSDGASTAVFGKQILLPQQYCIVTSSANAALFNNYGKVIGVSNFPTLNNGGDHLTLRDAAGQLIDSVSYDLTWYHDIDKQEGGWSLEIIDPDNLCSEGDNWAASEDPSGGTPGRANSIAAHRPDLTGPKLLTVAATSPTSLLLTFDEKLETDISAATVTLEPTIEVVGKSFAGAALRQIRLSLADGLVIRQMYSVRVTRLSDCSGNEIQAGFNQLTFALPEAADSLDVVINEVLFNPRPMGVDFVEVYNRSPKFINLKNWQAGNYVQGAVTSPHVISPVDFILSPGAYLVLTADPATLQLQYPQTHAENVLTVSLPSLPDDHGTFALQSDQGLVVDHFSYTQTMHSPFLKDKEGVSLERLSFSGFTNQADNWRSAAASAGFATPGYINSNARPLTMGADDAITLDPEIFSPATPGRDFSRINYRFDRSGQVANVKILDAEGRLIKTVANNETLGFEGFYRWDGDREDGTHARMGYYVVWVEVFDPSGAVTVYRKRAVIAK